MAPVVENIGYWGPPTSTLDWCESNYEVISMNDKYQHEYKLFFDILIATTYLLFTPQVSYYMAEFWNTITNLSMIIPPLNGIFQVYQQKFEFRYICSINPGNYLLCKNRIKKLENILK